MPVKNFQTSLKRRNSNRNLRRCSAGIGNMAVSPNGNLWGCYMFHDYFKTRLSDHQYNDYFFGCLEDFIHNHETKYLEIASNYAELRQDFFQVEDHYCFQCEAIDHCIICPVNAAYSTNEIGKISCSHCNLNTILMEVSGSHAVRALY